MFLTKTIFKNIVLVHQIDRDVYTTEFYSEYFYYGGNFTYTTYYLTLAYYYKTMCSSHNSGAIVGSTLTFVSEF